MKKKTRKNRELNDEYLPGYPLYPETDDITIRGVRVPGDIEDLEEGRIRPDDRYAEPIDEKLELLDQVNDIDLSNRVSPVDFAGSDLDIPGSESDDEQEAIGSEDEENNLYSLGGDNHQDLEESRE